MATQAMYAADWKTGPATYLGDLIRHATWTNVAGRAVILYVGITSNERVIGS